MFEEVRRQALEEFHKKGFPTTKDEAWKYTSLKTLSEIKWEKPQVLPHQLLLKNNLAKQTVNIFSQNLFKAVIVDGTVISDMSNLKNNSDVLFDTLASSEKTKSEVMSRFYQNTNSKTALSALNLALSTEGLFIWVKKETEIVDVMTVLHMNTQNNINSNVRNIIYLEKNAKASVLECFKGFDSSYFNNVTTSIILEEGAVLNYYKIQEEGLKSFHIHAIDVEQKAHSTFNSHLLSLGGKLVRNEINVALVESGSSVKLDGLFAVSRDQHVDNKTFIDHAVAHCKSEELYKGILDEKSHGVFSGEVLVREDAQKTDAKQTSKNLLLSDSAQIDTKPQLMIYADDVKCSHGATIGQLDLNSVFYLQSRGIDEKTARMILTRAFASEMIDKISNEPIKEIFDHSLQNWFNNQTLN